MLESAPEEGKEAASEQLEKSRKVKEDVRLQIANVLNDIDTAEEKLEQLKNDPACEVLAATDEMEDAREEVEKLEEKVKSLEDQLSKLLEVEALAEELRIAEEQLKEAEEKLEQAKVDMQTPEETAKRTQFALGAAEVWRESCSNKSNI